MVPFVSIVFTVIRVEPTEIQNQRNAGTNEDNKHADDMDVEYYCTSGEVTGEEDVGRGVARVMLGKSTFRGTIQKVLPSILSTQFEQSSLTLLTIINAFYIQYKDDRSNPSESPSGTFYVKFTNGTMLKMDASQAKHARVLFEKQAKKLFEVGIPQVDAVSIEQVTVTSSKKKHTVRDPVLEEGEDEDPENYEQVFEEVYDKEDMPDTIIGLTFKRSNTRFKELEVPLWEKVLM